MGVGGETENFIKGRLARAVVADREFADPEQRLEQHQVSTHAARQGREGDVIAAGIAERVEAFFAQSMNLREQVAWSTRDIVGAEESDDGRDAGERVARQRHRRYPGLEACFAATARDVHVTVDEAGNQSQSRKVDFGHAGDKRRWQRGEIAAVTHPEHGAAADQQGLQSQGAG